VLFSLHLADSTAQQAAEITGFARSEVLGSNLVEVLVCPAWTITLWDLFISRFKIESDSTYNYSIYLLGYLVPQFSRRPTSDTLLWHLG
jgi:hypothetical protein